MNSCRLLPLLATFFAASLHTAFAQAPEPRLHGNLREGARAALVGSMPPQVRNAADLGAVPAGYPLQGITLVFRPSLAQQAELDRLLHDQQDPASPEFHHWLTPEAFGERFGVAEADLATTERWLAAHGFQLTGRSRAKDRISFSGTAAQVQAAFGAPIHRFQVDGEAHIAPAADLTLPTDLAAITTAVLHLSDFRPHPLAHPAFTAGTTEQHFFGPQDFATLYDFPKLAQDDISQLPGTGQSIAIVGQSYTNLISGPVATFKQAAGAGDNITSVLVPGTGIEEVSPGDAGESELDLEYASSVSSGAAIFFVHVGNDQQHDIFDALSFAIDQNIASVVSLSYGLCEAIASPAFLQQANSLFQQAALQGQTLIASSGDTGATSCARHQTSPTFTAAQQQALAVSFPASSPWFTAVGGTQLAPGTFDAGSSPFWAPSYEGFDSNHTVLSYVPEIAWNESSPAAGLRAGGGGASSAFPRPDWQTGFPGLPSGATRVLPDISLQAAVSNPGFVFCTDDAALLGSADPSLLCSGGLRNANGHYTVGGGTSFAAPIFASMVAILNQTLHQPAQGNINPLLYRVAAAHPGAFHDILSGTTACSPTVSRCGAAGQANFAAAPGYDQATGLGSLDLQQLLAATPAAPHADRDLTYLTVNPFPYTPFPLALTANPGDPVTLQATVHSTDPNVSTVPVPSGTVAVSLDGVLLDPAVPFTSSDTYYSTSSISFPLTAPSATGSHLVTFAYSGDALHTASTTTAAILVGSVQATGTVNLVANNLSLPANGAGTTSVAITPVSGYNGRLFWQLALTDSSNNSSLPGCFSIPSVHVAAPTSVTLSLGLGTACSVGLPAARQQLRPLPALRTSPSPWQPAAATVVTGLLLCTVLPRGRRSTFPLLVLLLGCSAGMITLSGCGSGPSTSAAGSTPASPPKPTSAVTYTFKLTAQDSVNSSIQSSTNFTLSLQ